jgi:flagellar protein FliS
MNNGTFTYRKTDTMGKSQLDLIIQVYDSAIKSFRKANESFADEKWEAGRDDLEHAKRCVTHLYTTLDEDQGGEVAERLGKLYTFVICQCDIAAATKDKKLIDSNIKVLSNLRDGWSGLKDEQLESEPAEMTETPSAAGLNTAG